MLLPLLLLVAQAPQQESPVDFSCGPFLLQPGTRSMTVVVDHAQEQAARIQFWSGEGVRHVEHPQAVRHHVFELTELAPDTLYFYEITSEGLSSGRHQFRTLPEQPESYRVLVVGDVRSQPKVWGQVSQRMFEHEQDALFVIGTGDYPIDGREYQRWVDEFFAPGRNFLGRMPMWPAIGNHEVSGRHDDAATFEAAHFLSLFDLPGNERWYRVEYPLISLLVLDTNSRMAPGMAQYEWLRQQLRSARNRYTLVALHHQPITSGPHGALLKDGTPKEWPLDEGRRFLVPLFEMYDVDLVLGGHDHLYERSTKDGVTYIVTGGGGAPLDKIDSVPNPYQQVAVSTHHYVGLDIDAQAITLTAIDRNGAVIDSLRLESTAEHLARRTHSVTEELELSLRFDPIDVTEGTSSVHFFNPLDQPLDVSVRPARAESELPSLELRLEPQERRALEYRLPKLSFDPVAEPWRASVEVDLMVAFAGKDQALDVDLEWNQKVTVYQAQYSAGALSLGEPDGDLAEWGGVSKIHVDDRTPLIRHATAYHGPNDLGADIQLGWSPGLLHIAATIRDDQVLDDSATDIDTNDCLRLLFKLPGAPAGSVAVFSFSARGRLECKAGGELIRHRVREVEGGWVLEASLPLSLLGVAGDGRGSELSWDLLVADRDGDGEQGTVSYHRLWSTGRSLTRIEGFGLLRLVD